jgi:hypothetical protein
MLIETESPRSRIRLAPALLKRSFRSLRANWSLSMSWQRQRCKFGLSLSPWYGNGLTSAIVGRTSRRSQLKASGHTLSARNRWHLNEAREDAGGVADICISTTALYI